jgi:hypothetical protein
MCNQKFSNLYHFCVVTLSGNIDVFSFRTVGDCPKFSIKKFAQKYNLGNPIAGNLFQAQYDAYVPKLYGQFSHVYRFLNFILHR